MLQTKKLSMGPFLLDCITYMCVRSARPSDLWEINLISEFNFQSDETEIDVVVLSGSLFD